MKKAIQLCYNEFFEDRAAYAAAAGYEYLAIDFDINVTRGMDFDRAAEHICAVMEKWGLGCVQTHLPFYDLRESAEKRDADVEERVHKSIRATRAIGAGLAVLHPRTSITSGYNRAASFAENRKNVEAYLETAVAKDVKIAVENMPIFRGLSTAMPFFTSDYYDLCELTDGFDAKHVGICWDFGHANLMGFDHAEALRYIGKRLICTHIHNNFGNDDNHFTPDLGTADFGKLMPILREIGYDGPLTLEVKFYNKTEPVLRSFFAHGRNMLDWLEGIR